MTKLKGLFLLLLGALLVDFAVENALPSPVFKLIKFELGKLPMFAIVYGSFGIGFLSGWLVHVLKVKRQKRAAALAAEKAEPRQAPQEQE
ncbi:MAG: hypothetical protein AB1424_17010 [Thermodesulfobacteriota bacterium]